MPAREIETLVCERLATLFDDPLDLIASAWLDVPADRYSEIADRTCGLAARIRQRERDLVRGLLSRVQVQRDSVTISCSPEAIAIALDVATASAAPETLTLTHDVRLKRSGMAMRLVHDSGVRVGASPDRSLTRLIVQAHSYWRELRKGELDIKTLAAREGVSPSWVTRSLRLAFLAPDVTAAILKGTQHGELDGGRLVSTDAIAANWATQRRALLPVAR
jgi:site-specific DNA recombinase